MCRGQRQEGDKFLNLIHASPDNRRLSLRSVLIVLGAGIGNMLGGGPILFYTFGVMVQPIADATGWDRAHIASVGGITAIVLGLMSPVIGALLDRLRPRRMAMLGLVGGPLIILSGTLVLFGVIEPGSSAQAIATIPEFFWELSLGIYLIVKGFRASSPLLAKPDVSLVDVGSPAPAGAAM